MINYTPGSPCKTEKVQFKKYDENGVFIIDVTKSSKNEINKINSLSGDKLNEFLKDNFTFEFFSY